MEINLLTYYAEKATQILVTSSKAADFSLETVEISTTRILYKVIHSKFDDRKFDYFWKMINKRIEHEDFKNWQLKKSKIKILIIGAGPVGLRLGIELALLGLRVVIIEKRNE